MRFAFTACYNIRVRNSNESQTARELDLITTMNVLAWFTDGSRAFAVSPSSWETGLPSLYHFKIRLCIGLGHMTGQTVEFHPHAQKLQKQHHRNTGKYCLVASISMVKLLTFQSVDEILTLKMTRSCTILICRNAPSRWENRSWIRCTLKFFLHFVVRAAKQRKVTSLSPRRARLVDNLILVSQYNHCYQRKKARVTRRADKDKTSASCLWSQYQVA